MKLLKLLIEGRVQDFKKLLDRKFNSEVLQRIIDRDTSKDHKNLMWIGKILSTESDINIEELMNNLDLFNRIAKNVDLYQFKDYLSFINLLQQKSKEVQAGKLQQIKKSSKSIADTKRWQVIAPLSHDASKYFGGGTNWCISTSNEHYWNDHFYNNTVVFIKDRSKKPDDHLFKVALVADATGAFSTSSSDSRSTIIDDITDNIDFWKSNDHRMSKNEATRYLSQLDTDLINSIMDYFEDDDVSERRFQRLYDLAHERFQDDGKDILVKELFDVMQKMIKDIHFDYDVEAEDYDKTMDMLFDEEDWDWNEFLSELWSACISEQGVEDEDWRPSLYTSNIKRLIEQTSYTYEDVLELSKKALKSSEAYTVVDGIIRDAIRRNITSDADQRIDPYYSLVRHSNQMFPAIGYNGIITQSLQMYNSKVNPSFFQGQMSLKLGNEFAAIMNTYVPKTIDDVIKVLSINPIAADMVKWIQKYRKDLKESKKLRYRDFYKNYLISVSKKKT